MIVPALVALSLLQPPPAAPAAPPPFNHLDPAFGWVRYSGPDAATRWRVYQQKDFPSTGWSLREPNVLAHAANQRGGDLVTTDMFGDFELVGGVRLAAKANSGIMYRCLETADAAWKTGPEYQLLEDHTFPVAPDAPNSFAALYDLYPPPPAKVLRPAGTLNDVRLRLRRGVVQHWLNGAPAVEARLFEDDGSPAADFRARVAATKYKDLPGFAVAPRGHLALQDYGNEVEFHDLWVRDLDAPLPLERSLFNGRDLAGWVPFVPDAAKAGIAPAEVWRIDHGVLVCSGSPVGYLRTAETFTDFVLRLEWRFSPVTKKPGNSGVLLRLVGEDKVWPRSVEAQLQSGNAGDFWNIGDFAMNTDPARTNGRNTRKLASAERPVGEWNEYEIIVRGGDVVLFVNGQLVNRAWGVEHLPGFIALQSEGAEIHFRNIRLAPLD